MKPDATLEQVAFRWVLIVAAAAASIGLLAALTSSLVGALWGLALVLTGLARAFRAWRRSRAPGRRRVLLVAEGPLDPSLVQLEMAQRWAAEPHEVLVLVPSRHRGCAAEVERERQEMELSLQAVEEAGARASGRVVEDDPVSALAAARRAFAPHEIVIATRKPGSTAWLEVDLLSDVEEGTDEDTPITRRPLALG